MFELYGFGGTIAAGAWITIKVTMVSLLFGLIIGLTGASAKLSCFSLLRWSADAVTTVVRGIPELILILMIYFGSSVIINNIAKSLGYDGYIEISPFVAGVMALGTAFGAYATDIFRAAILAVPPGQIEAARALGMHKFLIFRRIMLPQVWRFALPAIGNLFLVLQKDSALVSVLGLQEIMRSSTMAVGYTKQPFTFYLFAAFIYLGLAILSTGTIQLLENRACRGVRRA